MKIAFEGQLLLNEQKTGIVWYAHNLILELAKNPENECIIQVFGLGKTKQELERLETYRKSGCEIKVCNWFSHKIYKLVWNILPIPYELFFKTRADVTHFFNYVVPPGVHGKVVTTVHDMCYKAVPETVALKTRKWLEICMESSVKRADCIVTDSKFSKKEIVKYLQVPECKIIPIHCGVDRVTYHPETKSRISEARSTYGIKEKYFLYLGTIEPRKNLEMLIGSFERLCGLLEKSGCEKNELPQLVLAGGRGWLCDGIYKKAEESRYRDSILFTGYINQKDSPALLSGALAFVFPSKYEGFGMPPLEAMSCGTSAIVSNAASLPEVVGAAGCVVSADDEDELAKAMYDFWIEREDRQLTSKRREYALKQASRFSWEIAAKQLEEIYQN
ncbi:MAG: glycosyltransferase family 4 protein [Lachnospiraceae bacterium]|nr:glycosyltransferase family 4 protein [Lachnospiraceae bacterium]